jgi:hypothetical protein
MFPILISYKLFQINQLSVEHKTNRICLVKLQYLGDLHCPYLK